MYWVVGAAIVVGAGVSAVASSNAAGKMADATREANAANTASHTMTPEEKAAFMTTGMSKVNSGYKTAVDMTSRVQAARGLGGDSLRSPLTDLGRQRIASIGDLSGSLAATEMNMRAGTPAPQPVYSGPGAANLFMSSIGNTATNLGSYYLGGKMLSTFKTQ